MNYKKDLLKIKKSKFRTILGMLFLAYTIYYFIDKFMGNSGIRVIDWLNIIIFALNGTIHTMEGFGISFPGLFGKAFISIDKDVIIIKERVIRAERKILWEEVTSVSSNYKIIQFSTLQGLTIVLKYSKYGYAESQLMKDAVYQIATEKGISINALQHK
jgi:hypothetical protein